MGYYVTITDSKFEMSKDDLPKAYKAMCDLNDHDELKYGGSYGGSDLSSNDSRPEGLDYHPARWFSWMSADYPNKCSNFEEVMTMLGIQPHYDAHGNVISLGYDNKTGQQDLFLEAIAPWVRDGSYIVWRGEDDSLWVDVFAKGAMATTSFDLDNYIDSIVEKMKNDLMNEVI